MEIDWSLFLMAFRRDVDYHDRSPQRTYLDRRTGDVLWLYETDYDAYMETGIPEEVNRLGRERVAAEPESYLLIPGLEHWEHHRILRDFLWSQWTEDEDRRQHAADAYTGSIGKWKRNVADREIVHAFYDYQEERIEELAREFLKSNGIVPKCRRRA